MDGTRRAIVAKLGVILAGQRFPSRHSDLIFNPIVSRPTRRVVEKSTRGRESTATLLCRNDRLGFAFIGLRNVHENQSAKFFVYKAICHPEEPVRGCGKRCVGGGADMCVRRGALRVSLRVRVSMWTWRDVRIDARRTPICEIRSR